MFLFAFSASADVISQQTISGVQSGSDEFFWVQSIGNGHSGTVVSLSFYLDFIRSADVGDDFYFVIEGAPTATSSDTVSLNSTTQMTITSEMEAAGKILVTGYLSSPLVLNPDHYYYLEFADVNGSPADSEAFIYGASGDVISGNHHLGEDRDEARDGTCGGSCGSVEDIYYVLRSDEAFSSDTRIISLNSPASGVITPSTNVLFDFDYYYGNNARGVTTVGIDVKDITAGFQYSPLEDTILASGQSTFTGNLVLTAGHLHLWRAYMRSATSTEFVSGWSSFDVVTASASSTQYIDPITGLPITSTSTGFFDFLNVPQLLQTKKPFAYIYQVGSLLETLDTISATGTPLFVLPLGMASTSLPGVGDIEFFSASTVVDLMPSSFITFMRSLIIAVIYISLAFVLFRNVGSIFS